MKISTILRKAADSFLWNGEGEYFIGVGTPRRYTCDAIRYGALAHRSEKSVKKVIGFLEDLGLFANGFNEFDEFAEGEERQGARFLWLHFAALVAEDEGL